MASDRRGTGPRMIDLQIMRESRQCCLVSIKGRSNVIILSSGNWQRSRAVGSSRISLRKFRAEGRSLWYAIAERPESPFVGEVLKQARMIERGIEHSGIEPGGNQECRYAHPELVKRELFGIAVGRDGGGWRYMIKKAAVLIVEQHHQRRLPQRLVLPQSIVHICHQRFAMHNIRGWVLVILARPEVIRLDKDILREFTLGARGIGGERIEFAVVGRIFELFEHNQCLGHIAVVDAPRHLLLAEPLKHRCLVVQMEARMKEPIRHVRVPKRRAAMHEEAIGPGRPRHGRKPVVADEKLLSQRMEDRQIAVLEIRHDLVALRRGRCRFVLREILDEPVAIALVNLPKYIIKVMRRIDRHGSSGIRQLGKHVRGIGIIGVLPRDSSVGIDAFELGVFRLHAPKHAVEGIVLQHQYDNVFYGIGWHGDSIVAFPPNLQPQMRLPNRVADQLVQI